MRLINCKISLQLKWKQSKRFLVAGTAVNQVPGIKIAVTKLYVQVVTLSTHVNIKLLKQLESGFKRTFTWNKYQSKTRN